MTETAPEERRYSFPCGKLTGKEIAFAVIWRVLFTIAYFYFSPFLLVIIHSAVMCMKMEYNNWTGFHPEQTRLTIQEVLRVSTLEDRYIEAIYKGQATEFVLNMFRGLFNSCFK